VVRLYSILVLAFVLSPLAAQDKLLAAIDAQASYADTDFSAEYTVVQKKAGQGESSTTLAVYRRESA